MSDFEREERYIVFKIKDLTLDQKCDLSDYIAEQGMQTVECVVVESDWPNYEHVWDTVKQVAEGTYKGIPTNHGLYIGWSGWYTRKGGLNWFRCEVIAFDDGEPVIKTAKGHFHRRPVGEYEFHVNPPAEGARS